MIKQIVILLLTFQLSFAQHNDKSISVVSAERINIVYRGIPNPIKIAVPGAKSFTATAPGLVKLDSHGNYKLSPGSGNEVIINIEAQMEDGFVIHEEKVFRIMGLRRPLASLYGNDSGYITLTKQELINAEIDISTGDFLFDINFKVYDFVLMIPDKKEIKVDGSKMSTEAINAIKKVKNGTIILLDRIRFMEKDPLVCFPYLLPVTVEIKN